MRPISRTIFGFVAAPLAPQFIIFTTSIKYHYFGQTHDIALYTLFVSCALTFLCLLPTHLILQRRGLVGLGDYVWMGAKASIVAGLALGVAVEVIRWYLQMSATLSTEIPFIFGFLGALLMFPVSSLFWIIARPDLNPPRISGVP
jgi:hypothetical protein